MEEAKTFLDEITRLLGGTEQPDNLPLLASLTDAVMFLLRREQDHEQYWHDNAE